MTKTNIKKILEIVFLCVMFFAVAVFSTACGETDISKEKLFEVNNTSKILDQYQTITIKSTSTNEDGSKTISDTSYYKDINGNIVIQSETKRIDGKLKNSSANFDGLSAILLPGGLLISFVICDDWNSTPSHQFNTFSKENVIITEDVKIVNEKIVVKTSTSFSDDTLNSTHYFNKDTYLIEKTETIATNSVGEITFQGVEEFFYGKQIINHSTAYQILSIANGNFSEVTVNYVDSNKSKVYYINKNAIIYNVSNYDNLDSTYKIYLDSACSIEFPLGTMLEDTNALWIKSN